MYRTTQTRDIDLTRTILFIIGLILVCAYLILENAVAGYISLLVEIAGGVSMLGLKWWWEWGPGKEKKVWHL